MRLVLLKPTRAPRRYSGGSADERGLSPEERLYSIYRYHAPYVRDAVNAIHLRIGRVLSATKVATTALRIANAQDADRNDSPDVITFSKEMADPEGAFRRRLEHLIPAGGEGDAEKPGTLFLNFKAIYRLLSYRCGAGEFWLPDVLLASLPVELWQVLVFWAVERTGPVDARSRHEVVRFALFWHLCVWNNEKAARWAFACIKQSDKDAATFPSSALYDKFVGSPDEDRCALRLTSPEEFEQKLCKSRIPSLADRLRAVR